MSVCRLASLTFFLFTPSVFAKGFIDKDSDLYTSLELGYGGSITSLSGAYNLDLLDQPFVVDKTDMFGGKGNVESGLFWIGSKKIPEWQIGLEYSEENQSVSVLGEALDGVSFLSDPAILEFNNLSKREDLSLNIGWSPLGESSLIPTVIGGFGVGSWRVESNSLVASDFLGELTQDETIKTSVRTANIGIGVQIPFENGFYLGMRSQTRFDISKDWEGLRSNTRRFIFSVGYQFGSRKFRSADNVLKGDRNNKKHIEAGVDFSQGSFNIDWDIDVPGPNNKEQPLEFKTKNLFNGSTVTKHLSYWQPVSIACSSEGENKDCPFIAGVQFFHQKGRGFFNGTIAEEGPLVSRDQFLDVVGRVTVNGVFFNIAYSPYHSDRIRAFVGTGAGLAHINAKMNNIHRSKDVFDVTESQDSVYVQQFFLGLGYKIAKNFEITTTSRYMFKQISWGLSLKYHFD